MRCTTAQVCKDRNESVGRVLVSGVIDLADQNEQNKQPEKGFIMDDDTEVKFSGHYIFGNPNNYVKYLVPSNMVSLYKNHPNWAGRLSQIDDIAKYTITRHNGKVDVTLNV